MSNYAGGGAVGGSWTDKIMDVKSATGQDNDGDGADDDEWVRFIMLTCLCNLHPLESHFYSVKLGFTGFYSVILNLAQKQRLTVLVRTVSNEIVLTSTHNLCFKQK